jgi:hypothetical protein
VRTRLLRALAVVVLLMPGAPPAGGPALAEPLVNPPERLDQIPGGTRESVTRLLQKVRRRYGEGAVVIQTQLLLNAMRHGAVLATGVRVDGVKKYRGTRYLGFHLDTGLIFDDLTRDGAARVQMLWATIMEPTLASLAGLEVPAEGIKVEMQYHHRPYRSQGELRRTIDQPGVSEETSFYVRTADVSDLGTPGVTPRDLFRRCRIAVDGTEREIAAPSQDPPGAPGPM